MNHFALAVVMLFVTAAAVEAWNGNIAKSVFFFFSAAINVCVLFMK